VTEETLDTILSGSPATEEPKGEPETVIEPVKVEAAPPAAEKEPTTVPLAALQDERRKRQEHERDLRALRDEVAKLKQPKPVEEPKVGLLDDPDKWEAQLQKRIDDATSKVRQEAQENYFRLLERQARERHKGEKITFEDAGATFAEAAKNNSALIAEAMQADDPAEYVYQAGRKLKMLSEAGDLDALLASAREEGRLSALGEVKKSPEIPESLTDVTGAKSVTKVWAPKPLSELLNH